LKPGQHRVFHTDDLVGGQLDQTSATPGWPRKTPIAATRRQGKEREMMARKDWTVALVAAGGTLIALNWAAVAYADPAPPPTPATAPSEAPPLPDAINNGPLWTGDYDDGDIYIIPIL
jgi:hypothetical protein